jgi:hypothetical protein
MPTPGAEVMVLVFGLVWFSPFFAVYAIRVAEAVVQGWYWHF